MRLLIGRTHTKSSLVHRVELWRASGFAVTGKSCGDGAVGECARRLELGLALVCLCLAVEVVLPARPVADQPEGMATERVAREVANQLGVAGSPGWQGAVGIGRWVVAAKQVVVAA